MSDTRNAVRRVCIKFPYSVAGTGAVLLLFPNCEGVQMGMSTRGNIDRRVMRHRLLSSSGLQGGKGLAVDVHVERVLQREYVPKVEIYLVD